MHGVYLIVEGVSLPMAGRLELDDLWGPFQPKLFCDSMNMKSCLSRILMQMAWEKGVEKERSFSRN